MGPLLNPIRAILFDADGVIQHTPPAFHQALIDVAGKAGADPAELLPAIFSAERPAIIGQGSFAEALAPVLERFGLADALQDLLPAWHLIEPDRRALAFVEELRTRRFTCCLATNQQDVRRHYMSHELGYRTIFDREYYSCDIGHRKPDAAYFHHILGDLALEPAAALFIDDAEVNVAAARETGMATIHYSGGDLRARVEKALARQLENLG